MSKQASWKMSGWVDSGVCQSEVSEWNFLAEKRPQVYNQDREWLNWSVEYHGPKGSKITERLKWDRLFIELITFLGLL